MFDNADRVEKVFGHAVGLPRALWESLNNGSTYRDAVASIIKARVSASTVDAIDNIVSLALGIPIAPYRSIIKDIDYAYRVDPNGVPTEYHVVLEEISSTDTRTGRLSTHEVSASNGLRLASTSGMANNPSTGSKYAAGDIVEQYASIGEGVRVVDLYTTDLSFSLHDVLDRHRFAVLMDVDSVSGLAANPEKLSLMHTLILEAKPAYTDFFIRMLKYLVDFIDIEDDIFIKVRSRVYDNPYHHRGPANIYDDNIPGTADNDNPTLLPLTTWFPRDGQIEDISPDGTFTLKSGTGGFIEPTVDMGDVRFNPTGIYPWIEPGDYVTLLSNSSTKLIIQEVVNDTTLRVATLHAEDAIQVSVLPTEAVRFFVYRALKDHVVRADVDLPIEGGKLGLSFIGPSSTNFGMGDILTLSTDTGINTGRLRVLDTEFDPISGNYAIATYPPPRGVPGTSTGTVRIFRELITDREIKGIVSPQLINDAPYVDIGDNAFTIGLDVGHMLDIHGVMQSRIVGICGSRVFTELPILPVLVDTPFTSYKIDTNTGADDLDEHELAIGSSVQVILHGVEIRATRGGSVSSDIIRPGDILLTEIPIDLGEGVGVIRVASQTSGRIHATNLVGLSNEVLEAVPPIYNCSLIRQDALHSDYFFTDRSTTEVAWGNVRVRP